MVVAVELKHTDGKCFVLMNMGGERVGGLSHSESIRCVLFSLNGKLYREGTAWLNGLFSEIAALSRQLGSDRAHWNSYTGVVKCTAYLSTTWIS